MGKCFLKWSAQQEETTGKTLLMSDQKLLFYWCLGLHKASALITVFMLSLPFDTIIATSIFGTRLNPQLNRSDVEVNLNTSAWRCFAFYPSKAQTRRVNVIYTVEVTCQRLTRWITGWVTHKSEIWWLKSCAVSARMCNGTPAAGEGGGKKCQSLTPVRSLICFLKCFWGVERRGEGRTEENRRGEKRKDQYCGEEIMAW